jgi:hypothetical protein
MSVMVAVSWLPASSGALHSSSARSNRAPSRPVSHHIYAHTHTHTDIDTDTHTDRYRYRHRHIDLDT